MTSKLLSTSAVVLAGISLFTISTVHAAPGGSASATMAVTATVSNNCTISTNPVAFGSYDPIVAQASASLDGAGSVVIACTKGAVTTVALDAGANSSAGARRLAAGSSYINYQLYSDSNRSTAWGSDAGSTVAPGAAPSKAARTLTVYGRITGGQDVPAGSYTDTITATINF